MGNYVNPIPLKSWSKTNTLPLPALAANLSHPIPPPDADMDLLELIRSECPKMQSNPGEIQFLGVNQDPTCDTDDMLDSPSAKVFMEEYEMESWLHYGMELDLLDPMMELSTPSPPIELPSLVAEPMMDELQKIVDSGMEVVGEDPRDNVAVPLDVEVDASDQAGSSTNGGVKQKAVSESDEALGPKREEAESQPAGKQRVIRRANRSATERRARAAAIHSLSERRRRDRINENMKTLQKLIPRCNKTDKASMLDEAIDYMKSLQLQVQIMTMACDNLRAMMYPGASRASGVQGFYPLGVAGITTGVKPIASMNGGLLLGTEVAATGGSTAQPLISFGQVFTAAVPLSGSPQVLLAPKPVSSPNKANIPDKVSERAADPPVPALVSTNSTNEEPSLLETPTTADPNTTSQGQASGQPDENQ